MAHVFRTCGFQFRAARHSVSLVQPAIIKSECAAMRHIFHGALISGVCAILFQQAWTVSALIGVQMGLFSFGANASMFKGFAVGKASLVAILTGLPSVVVVFVAYLIWDERLNIMQFLAFVIIVIGILVVRYSNDITLKICKARDGEHSL